MGRKIWSECEYAHSVFYGLSNTLFFLSQKVGTTEKNRFQIWNQHRKLYYKTKKETYVF